MSALILLSAGTVAHTMRADRSGDGGALGLETARIAVEDSAFVDETLDAAFRETLQAREILYRTYGPATGVPVWVFLAYFDRQREGSQVHSPRHCYPGSGWGIEDELVMPAGWRNGNVNALVVNNGVARRLVCYWYQVPDGVIADVFRLKLALMARALRGHPQEAVYGNVSTPIDGDAQGAFEQLVPYVRGAEAEVARLFRQQDEGLAGTQ
jgi:EpsI family protein